SRERFKVMERKLYWGIMTPGGVLTLVFGAWLWLGWVRGAGGWLHAELALGAVLAGHPPWGGRLLGDFAAGRNHTSPLWLGWLSEFPVLILVAAVLVVVFKPF